MKETPVHYHSQPGLSRTLILITPLQIITTFPFCFRMEVVLAQMVGVPVGDLQVGVGLSSLGIASPFSFQ